ncbi:MAG: di-heme-cytochrome C peroxidase [Mariprofundaceae bacterium]
MLRSIGFSTVILISGLMTGCTYMSQGLFPDREMAAEAVSEDYFGDSAKEVVYLESQQWDASDSLWFYNTTQGSDLIPYDIFLNLKTADSANELFRSSSNMRRYRYLTQNPSMDNSDGLPVGFVKDDFDGRQYLGFTCAACHTTQVNYQGVGMRIDGGPAMADMDSMLRSLEKALDATLSDKKKINDLAAAIDNGEGELSAADFKSELAKARDKVANYNKINLSQNGGHPVEYGYARLDAFGRIYNRVLAHLTPDATFNSPNAPVSYPFLWDTPQYDFVQWNGVGNNNSGGAGGFFGPLGRNTGEVLGVFATFDVEDKPVLRSVQKSSADQRNLVRLEKHLEDLKAPVWPENILPEINRQKAALGEKVFVQYKCIACHTPENAFTKEQLKSGIVAQFSSVERIGTDIQMAHNAIHYNGKTGVLKGKSDSLSGGKYGDTAPAVNSLTTVTTSAIVAPDHTKRFFVHWAEKLDSLVRSFFSNPVTKKTSRHVDFQVVNTPSLDVYKGRSLNGIWATAPYLHNGSVPNLHELFLPACSDAEIAGGKACRSNTFTLGTREFDPMNVGFENKSKEKYPGLFTFDTSLPGNGNRGHEYAAGVTPMIKLDANGKPMVNAQGQIETMKFAPMNKKQRYALVEYLKTL